MFIPLIPAWVLFALCVLIVLLTVPAVYKIPSFSPEKMITLFAAGLIFLAAGFLVYGILYYYFTTYVIDVEIRQRCVRFTFMFLQGLIVTWLFAIISSRKGKS